jgi:NADH-quinone oxidoreductase subunit L
MDLIQFLLLMIPAAPLLAAILIPILAPICSRRMASYAGWLAIGAVAISCLASLGLVREVVDRQRQFTEDNAGFEQVVNLWTWADVTGAYQQPLAPPSDADPDQVVEGGMRDFTIDIALRADSLTAMMLAMVTSIALLVVVFSTGYMKGDPGYWRFFCYLSLFVFSMTMLVLSSNFLLLFVFWEAVGLCSYLLIGFWYEKPAAAAAGKKAFLVNRIGDFGFALGLFLIWTTYGTLNYHSTAVVVGSSEPLASASFDESSDLPSRLEGGQPLGTSTILRIPIDSVHSIPSSAEKVEIIPGVLSRPESSYRTGGIAFAICLLLLLGACGKSAQFPLHVWLPDAMEGPTPVSALIHAATMVTAGIYMVARCTPLFMASPEAQLVVACIGGFTALLAALIALTQFDLKRVLAYSTVSQLGFMFLGLGTGTFAGITGGMFHLFTHAFFKALLFLGAGSVMHAMGNVIDMRRFGGLRRIMPVTHWTFLVGCLALAGIFPLSGFWSKDTILGALHDRIHHADTEHHAGVVSSQGDLASVGVPGNSASATPLTPVAMVAASAADGHSAWWLWSEETAVGVYRLLYYLAILTAGLTAFYTFRAFYMTFHGETRVPPEAGHHAHESPRSMTVPLAILAVCGAVVGLYLDRSYTSQPSNLLSEFLGGTPSLATGAVAATRVPVEFHMDVAATSLLVAVIGLALAAFLYLGDRWEVRWLSDVLSLQWHRKLTDSHTVARLGQLPMLQNCHQCAQRVGLGWLTLLLGSLAWYVIIILLSPLLLLATFVSPYRLSANKFYFDELYEFVLVRPLRGLGRVCELLDRFVIDGAVNTVGRIPVALGNIMRSLQMGLVQFYALAMVLGVLLLFLVRVWSGN